MKKLLFVLVVLSFLTLPTQSLLADSGIFLYNGWPTSWFYAQFRGTLVEDDMGTRRGIFPMSPGGGGVIPFEFCTSIWVVPDIYAGEVNPHEIFVVIFLGIDIEDELLQDLLAESGLGERIYEELTQFVASTKELDVIFEQGQKIILENDNLAPPIPLKAIKKELDEFIQTYAVSRQGKFATTWGAIKHRR